MRDCSICQFCSDIHTSTEFDSGHSTCHCLKFDVIADVINKNDCPGFVNGFKLAYFPPSVFIIPQECVHDYIEAIYNNRQLSLF